jgi:hypothetical protein
VGAKTPREGCTPPSVIGDPECPEACPLFFNLRDQLGTVQIASGKQPELHDTLSLPPRVPMLQEFSRCLSDRVSSDLAVALALSDEDEAIPSVGKKINAVLGLTTDAEMLALGDLFLAIQQFTT